MLRRIALPLAFCFCFVGIATAANVPIPRVDHPSTKAPVNNGEAAKMPHGFGENDGSSSELLSSSNDWPHKKPCDLPTKKQCEGLFIWHRCFWKEEENKCLARYGWRNWLLSAPSENGTSDNYGSTTNDDDEEDVWLSSDGGKGNARPKRGAVAAQPSEGGECVYQTKRDCDAHPPCKWYGEETEHGRYCFIIVTADGIADADGSSKLLSSGLIKSPCDFATKKECERIGNWIRYRCVWLEEKNKCWSQRYPFGFGPPWLLSAAPENGTNGDGADGGGDELSAEWKFDACKYQTKEACQAHVNCVWSEADNNTCQMMPPNEYIERLICDSKKTKVDCGNEVYKCVWEQKENRCKYRFDPWLLSAAPANGNSDSADGVDGGDELAAKGKRQKRRAAHSQSANGDECDHLTKGACLAHPYCDWLENDSGQGFCGLFGISIKENCNNYSTKEVCNKSHYCIWSKAENKCVRRPRALLLTPRRNGGDNNELLVNNTPWPDCDKQKTRDACLEYSGCWWLENNCTLCDPYRNDILHSAYDKICLICHEMYSDKQPEYRAECTHNCYNNEKFRSCLKTFRERPAYVAAALLNAEEEEGEGESAEEEGGMQKGKGAKSGGGKKLSSEERQKAIDRNAAKIKSLVEMMAFAERQIARQNQEAKNKDTKG